MQNITCTCAREGMKCANAHSARWNKTVKDLDEKKCAKQPHNKKHSSQKGESSSVFGRCLYCF